MLICAGLPGAQADEGETPKPPPGIREATGAGSGRPVVAVTTFRAAHRPTGIESPEGTTLVHSYCPELEGGNFYVHGSGCFEIYRDDREADPSASYYLEKFQVHAYSKEDVSLVRVKGRNAQDKARNIAADPGEDRPIGEPTDVTVGVPPLSVTFTAYPGMIHPYVGKHVFHSSWIASSRAGDPGPASRRSAGINKWKVLPGDFVTESGSWSVRYRPPEELAPGQGPPDNGTPTKQPPQ